MIFVSELSKSYGDKRVIDRLSFSLPSRGLTGFLGINGVGKTTTLRMLTGCLSPCSGKIQINGFDMSSQCIDAKRSIGYLPERTPLYTHVRVREFLFFRASLKRPEASRLSVAQAVDTVLDYCSLKDYSSFLIRNLSKGYRQRVGLAEALLWLPPVLILDEPTVGLDPQQRADILGLIQSLSLEHAILFSSHNLSEVQEICDTVVILHEGRICAEGAPSELEVRLIKRKISLDVIVSSEIEPLVEALKTIADHLEDKGVSVFQGGETVQSFELSFRNVGSLEVCKEVAELCMQKKTLIVRLMPRQLSLEEIFLSFTNSPFSDNFSMTDVSENEPIGVQ